MERKIVVLHLHLHGLVGYVMEERQEGCYVMYGFGLTIYMTWRHGGPKRTLFCWLYYEYSGFYFLFFKSQFGGGYLRCGIHYLRPYELWLCRLIFMSFAIQCHVDTLSAFNL